MKPAGRKLREGLIKAERVTPDLKHRYEQEVQIMLERQLSSLQCGIWLATAVFSAACAVWFLVLAIIQPASFPLLGRIGLGVGSLFSVAWSVLGIKIFRRGKLHLKIDTGIVAALSWVLPVFLVTVFLLGMPDSIMGLRMILFAMVLLIGGGVALIRHVVEQSDLNNREKLLRLEYQLAALTESLLPPDDTERRPSGE
jgi:hypothetical protein